MLRTDRNMNPTAFTTALAKQAGLVNGVDYAIGDPFEGGVTAKLLKDPVETTIRLIDSVGFLTAAGQPRWTYISMPRFVWQALGKSTKIQLIGWMYEHEGGTDMQGLFK